MISLLFKILADAAGFNRTMETELPATAKKGGEKAGKEAGGTFGKEFGSQVKGAVLSAIGAGAIVAAIKKTLEEAADIAKESAQGGISVEATQELRRASKLTGLSVEQLKASATTAPQEFSALMRYVQKTGGPALDKADVETLTSAKGVFSGFGDIFSKGVAKAGSFLGGSLAGAASSVAAGVASAANLQSQVIGVGGPQADQLMRASVMLGQMRDASFERGFGIAQGSTPNAAGDLLRKLEQIDQTLKEKL